MICSRCRERPARPTQRWCAECSRDYQRLRNEARRAGRVPIKTPTEKPCYQCKRVLPARAFNKNMAKADGLDHVCRTCRSSRWHTYAGPTRHRVAKPKAWASRPFERKRALPSLAHLSEADRAYIAGVIDGEGYVAIHGIDDSASVWIFVGNTNFDLLDWLKAKLGGYLALARAATERHKECRRWHASALRARAILEAVAPFLIVKRRHAELIRAFYEAVPAYKEAHPGRLRPGHLHEPLRSILAELRWLNRRGPRKPFQAPPPP